MLSCSFLSNCVRAVSRWIHSRRYTTFQDDVEAQAIEMVTWHCSEEEVPIIPIAEPQNWIDAPMDSVITTEPSPSVLKIIEQFRTTQLEFSTEIAEPISSLPIEFEEQVEALPEVVDENTRDMYLTKYIVKCAHVTNLGSVFLWTWSG